MEGHMHIALYLYLSVTLVLVQLILISYGGEAVGLRVDLRRRDDHLSFPQRFRAALDRSNRRVGNITLTAYATGHRLSLANNTSSKFAASATVLQTPVRWGDGEFLMKVAVGTPGVGFEAIVDTGSDLIWTECEPCRRCTQQPTPLFDPTKSTTYRRAACTDPLCRALQDGRRCTTTTPAACGYIYSYADRAVTGGAVAYDTFTIGRHAKLPGIAFGCAHQNNVRFHGQGGIVGLGRGPLSLLSQLASASASANKFSYCLLPITHPRSKTSPLFFGDAANINKPPQTLTFIKNEMNPSQWYIPMTGMSVAGMPLLPLSARGFRLKSNTGEGGVIIDSGSTLTYFVKSIYRPLRRAIKRAVKLKPVRDPSAQLDLCYNMPARWPSLAFHFEGGAEMQLPARNYFIEAGPGVWCLAIIQSFSHLSILGNIAQQNFHILYDDAMNKLSFAPQSCGSL